MIRTARVSSSSKIQCYKTASRGFVSFTTTAANPKGSLVQQQQQQQQQRRSSSSSSSKMSPKTTDLTSSSLLSLLSNRRSYYALDSSSTAISDTQIQSIISSILLSVPSAFNSQSTRLVLALGPSHHKIWDLVGQLLRAHMGEQRWSKAPTAGKIAGFRAARGTVLFYEDTATVEAHKTKFPGYADKFGQWSEHTSGMHQLAVWCALEAEGLGANLQHYNGLAGLEEGLAKEFLDGSEQEEGKKWELKAQLVFGGIADGKRPAEKEKLSLDRTLRVFGTEKKD